MTARTYDEIVELAANLTRDEQLRLIAHLALTSEYAHAAPDRSLPWSDLRGTAPYPAVGEEAQAWVSRGRQESDDTRERRMRDTS